MYAAICSGMGVVWWGGEGRDDGGGVCVCVCVGGGGGGGGQELYPLQLQREMQTVIVGD